MSKKIKKPVLEYVWKDRKRNFLGLPWTFTKYRLTKDRLFIITGLFNTREDEVRLYRITDTTMTRSFGQKLTGTGTIHCDSADQTMKNFDIKNIKHPREFKELFIRTASATSRMSTTGSSRSTRTTRQTTTEKGGSARFRLFVPDRTGRQEPVRFFSQDQPAYMTPSKISSSSVPSIVPGYSELSTSSHT